MSGCLFLLLHRLSDLGLVTLPHFDFHLIIFKMRKIITPASNYCKDQTGHWFWKCLANHEVFDVRLVAGTIRELLVHKHRWTRVLCWSTSIPCVLLIWGPFSFNISLNWLGCNSYHDRDHLVPHILQEIIFTLGSSHGHFLLLTNAQPRTHTGSLAVSIFIRACP